MKFFSIVVFAALTACAARAKTIGTTPIPDNELNRTLIAQVEAYRNAMESKDPEALLLLVSKNYWEDSGTPTGSDDYGYDGLLSVLRERLQQVTEVRFSLRYMAVSAQCVTPRNGCRGRVEGLIDASYTVEDALGKKQRPDKRDQAEFVLEYQDGKWLFVSGM